MATMGTKVKIELKLYIVANNFFMIMFREKQNVQNRKVAEENSTFISFYIICCISIIFLSYGHLCVFCGRHYIFIKIINSSYARSNNTKKYILNEISE